MGGVVVVLAAVGAYGDEFSCALVRASVWMVACIPECMSGWGIGWGRQRVGARAGAGAGARVRA
jgi:hypothetical protein